MLTPCDAADKDISENAQIILNFLDQLWKQREFDTMSDLMACDQTLTDKQFQILSGDFDLQDFKHFSIVSKKYVENFNFELLRELSIGSQVVLELNIHMKLATKKEPCIVSGVTWCTVDNGRIISGRNYFDLMPILEDIGAMPEECYKLCLSGARFQVGL